MLRAIARLLFGEEEESEDGKSGEGKEEDWLVITHQGNEHRSSKRRRFVYYCGKDCERNKKERRNIFRKTSPVDAEQCLHFPQL